MTPYRLTGNDTLSGRTGRALGLGHRNSVGVPGGLRGRFLFGGLEPAENTVAEHCEFGVFFWILIV